MGMSLASCMTMGDSSCKMQDEEQGRDAIRTAPQALGAEDGALVFVLRGYGML